MLHSSKIIAFVATRDADRARKFYESVLGLALISDDPFALVFEAHGTMLRLTKVREHTPARHTVLGWEVEDIRSAVSSLQSQGVTFQRYEGLPQDDLAIWTAPGGARVAWFHDPDGNTLSLTQFG